MNFSLPFRRNFLEFCGIKAELRSNENLFQEYSQCSIEGITIGIFWDILVGEFSTFQSQYRASDLQTNYADVEMRAKLLKMFTGAQPNKPNSAYAEYCAAD